VLNLQPVDLQIVRQPAWIDDEQAANQSAYLIAVVGGFNQLLPESCGVWSLLLTGRWGDGWYGRGGHGGTGERRHPGLLTGLADRRRTFLLSGFTGLRW